MALSISALLFARGAILLNVALQIGMRYNYGKDEFCGAYAYNLLTLLSGF